MASQKEIFDLKAGELFSKQSSNAGMLSANDYHQRAVDLEKWTSMDSINIKYEFPEAAIRARYYRMVKNGWFTRRSDEDDIEMLLRDGDNELQVSHLGRLFDDLNKVHVESNHRRGKSMRTLVNKHFANIGRDYVEIYIATCHECSLRKAKLDASKVNLIETDDQNIDDQTRFENALLYYLSSRVFLRSFDNITLCCYSGTLILFGSVDNKQAFWRLKLTTGDVHDFFEDIGISFDERDLQRYAELLGRALQDDRLTIAIDDDGCCCLLMVFNLGGSRIAGRLKVSSSYNIIGKGRNKNNYRSPRSMRTSMITFWIP